MYWELEESLKLKRFPFHPARWKDNAKTHREFLKLHGVAQSISRKNNFQIKRKHTRWAPAAPEILLVFSISSSSFSFIHLHHSCLLLSCVFAWGLNPLPKWTHTHTTHADLIMYTHTDPACYSCLYGTHERCTRGFSLTTKKWRPKQKCNTYNNKKKGTSPSILKKK